MIYGAVSPETAEQFERICARTGMSKAELLKRLTAFLDTLTATELALLLGVIDDQDVPRVAELVLRKRRGRRK